jgi:hypothetical protein
MQLSIKIMQIFFEDEKETKIFLKLCWMLGKILEENKKFKNQKVL